MQLLYKSITSAQVVTNQECYLVGVELSHSANTSMIVYDEALSTSTAARKVANMRCTSYTRQNSMFFPGNGLKCEGIYAAWTTGVGTVYYHY